MSDTAGEHMAKPENWTWVGWALCPVFALLVAPIIAFDDDEDIQEIRWSAGHQVMIGIAILEIGLVWHFVHYPSTFIGPAVIVAYAIYDGAVALWDTIPILNWEPWYVTSGLTLVGLVPLASGIRPAFGADEESEGA